MANSEYLKNLQKGVAAWNEWRIGISFCPDLSGADLSGADLSRANLGRANLSRANLSGANLSGADLGAALLSRSNLNRADLTEADLSATDFANASLSGTNLSKGVLDHTVLVNVDLSEVKGLGAVQHKGPSSIGIDTYFKSKGRIPAVFLRGAGVPEIFLQYGASLAGTPFEFYSCFISFSTRDDKFVRRLYSDLTQRGIRCWYAPVSLKIGENFRIHIDKAIRVHDKLVVVLSRNSVQSDWVEREVKTAFDRERQTKRTVLFPLRLDDAVMHSKAAWANRLRGTKQIGDFRHWQDQERYSEAFSGLLKSLSLDLAIEELRKARKP